MKRSHDKVDAPATSGSPAKERKMSQDEQKLPATLTSSTTEFMTKVQELYTNNFKSRREQLDNLLFIKTNLDSIKNEYFKGKSKPMSSAEEKLESTINQLADMIRIHFFVIGNPGFGKSTTINIILGMDLLPTNADPSHVTKSIVLIQHSDNFKVEVDYCNEKEFSKRLLLSSEFSSFNYVKRESKRKQFSSVGEVRKYMEEFYCGMTDEDVVALDKVTICAPVQLLKDFGITLYDTPGLNSGASSVLFKYITDKFMLKANVIAYISDGMRGELSTNIFPQVVSQTLEKLQYNPPSIKFIVGGRAITNTDGGYRSFKEEAQKPKVVFTKLLSKYADVDLDDLVGIDTKDIEGTDISREEFQLKNSRSTCLDLVNNFATLVIPNSQSNHYEDERSDLIEALVYELVREQQKIFENEKNHIIDMAISLVPMLLSNCVHNFTDKQIECYLKKVEIVLCDYMNTITKKFIDTALEAYSSCDSNSFSDAMNANSESLPLMLKKMISNEQFLKICQEGIENSRDIYVQTQISEEKVNLLKKNLTLVLDSCRHHIDSWCKKLFDEIKKDGKLESEFNTEFLNNHKEIRKKISESMNHLAEFFNQFFNRQSGQRVVLLVETKGELFKIFENYKKMGISTDYIYGISTELQVPKRELAKHCSLTLPTKNYLQDSTLALPVTKNQDNAWNNIKKCLANNDSILSKKIDRSMSNSLTEVVVDGSGQRLQIDSNPLKFKLFNMPQINNLENFQQFLGYEQTSGESRVAPIIIFGRDVHFIKENSIFNILPGYLKPDQYVGFVLCLEKDVEAISAKIGTNNSFHIIKVQCSKFNKGTFETLALQVARHYKFTIYHTMTLKTGIVSEYIKSLRDFSSTLFTVIRYLRFSECAMHKEMYDVEKSMDIIANFLKKLRKYIAKNDLDNFEHLLTDNSYGDLTNNIPEQFLSDLRNLDDEIRKNQNQESISFYEEFLKTRLATNKCRMVLWNGQTSMVDASRVYNSEKANYFISNKHDCYGINTNYTPSMINALEDSELVNGKYDDETSEISLKTGMLLSGAGQFLCYGFKFEKETLY